jgi:predicted small lipoprotein YifL
MTVPTFRICKEFALKSIFKGAAVAAMMLSLAACGGKGDDKLGDQAEQAADNRADAMEATADNMTGTDRAAMQADAEATRAAGDAREEAIDDADVNADAMSNGQKAAIVNGQ